MVVLIISYPGWPFLPHPADMQQQETNTIAEEIYPAVPKGLLLSQALFLRFVLESIHCNYTELQLPKTFLLRPKLIEANITLASSAWSEQ